MDNEKIVVRTSRDELRGDRRVMASDTGGLPDVIKKLDTDLANPVFRDGRGPHGEK